MKFFVSLGIAEILGFFLSFLFILKLSYSKPFYNTLNYASAANIKEVMNFYNLGDKTFETDFRLHCSLCTLFIVTLKVFSSVQVSND